MLKLSSRKIGNCFLVQLQWDIPRNLDARQYDPFSLTKAFAGFSKARKMLSHKPGRVPGPALIGGYPCVINLPDEWIRVSSNNSNIVTVTPTPRLAVIIEETRQIGDISALAIHPDDCSPSWRPVVNYQFSCPLDDSTVSWLSENPTKAQFGRSTRIGLASTFAQL